MNATSSDSDHLRYQIVAARRLQWDNLLWQVPVLSLTAQAFLFTIAPGPETSRLARLISSVLAFVSATLSIHLMVRHRQAEITDAHWTRDYEERHFGSPVHGPGWAQTRTAKDLGLPPRSGPTRIWVTVLNRLARRPAFVAWTTVLGLFGLAAVSVLVVTVIAPDALTP